MERSTGSVTKSVKNRCLKTLVNIYAIKSDKKELGTYGVRGVIEPVYDPFSRRCTFFDDPLSSFASYRSFD
jgi:hypothetical protein